MLKQLDINIISLNYGKHEFTWSIDKTFFDALEEPIIDNGSLNVTAILLKAETMITVDLAISGSVELTCDRSLEEFEYEFETSTKHFFKYNEEYEEISEEVTNIPHKLEKLSLAQLIYETIGIAIPMKKLHPRFVDEINEDDDEEIELVYSNKSEEVDHDDFIDPRWAALQKLKETN